MILLDTNALIWLMGGSSRFGPSARNLVENRHPVHYSSISVLEITIKSMKGRLSVGGDLCTDLDGAGLRQMPFVGEHAEALTEFPELVTHDQFDRALLAQALSEGLQFVTSDRRLLALERDWIVDASA